MLEGQPSSGVRVEVERLFPDDAEDGTVTYVGYAHLATESVPLTLRASSRGVEVRLEATNTSAGSKETARDGLIAVVSALVRAATKRELSAGAAPPRRIVRWRPFEGA